MNLVIGMSNTFDTEIPHIISADSVQGQFLDRIYCGDRSALDEDLGNALAGTASSGSIEKPGKTKLYDVGTIASIRTHRHGERLRACGAVSITYGAKSRGLDALIYGTYSDARFIVVGTPAGITLAPEGGAHQSTITASVGLELPGVDFCEPAFATALDWLLCDALRRLGDPSGSSTYLRLSTRPIDQKPFTTLEQEKTTAELHSDVLAGGYRLWETSFPDFPQVILAGSGAVMPELLSAATELEEEGVGATVLDITSLGRLYVEWSDSLRHSSRHATTPGDGYHLAKLVPRRLRGAPIVTVHDAASHAMAWLGSVFGQRVIPIGVDEFGESGTIAELYGRFGLLPPQIVNSALVGLAANGTL